MRKSERLFQLVNLIRVHQPVTAQVLAERVGVSLRSIYRYIDDLSLSGIPVYGVAGVGYSLSEDFELPPLNLTHEELDALMLGVEMLSNAAGNQLAGSARSLLSKIIAARPTTPQTPATHIPSPFRALRVRPATQDQVWLDELSRAIRGSRAVSFTYLSLDGVTTERHAFPMGLFYWGGKWTAGCWCLSRQAWRDFRIDRMSDLQVSHEQREPDAEWNMQVYMHAQATQWAQRKVRLD